MSYNISNWKTKKLENLIIPLASLYKSIKTDWHPSRPTIINEETMEVVFTCACGSEIQGYLNGGNVYVTKIEIDGEGSGSFMNFVLEDALKESTGLLEAVLIWEDGDTITKLILNNGKLEEEDIEL